MSPVLKARCARRTRAAVGGSVGGGAGGVGGAGGPVPAARQGGVGVLVRGRLDRHGRLRGPAGSRQGWCVCVTIATEVLWVNPPTNRRTAGPPPPTAPRTHPAPQRSADVL